MAAELRTWDDNSVDELCNIVFAQYVLGNLIPYFANDQVWENITGTLNARTGKAFNKRRVIRMFKKIRQSIRRNDFRVPRFGHWGNVPPVAPPNRLEDDPPQ